MKHTSDRDTVILTYINVMYRHRRHIFIYYILQ